MSYIPAILNNQQPICISFTPDEEYPQHQWIHLHWSIIEEIPNIQTNSAVHKTTDGYRFAIIDSCVRVDGNTYIIHSNPFSSMKVQVI